MLPTEIILVDDASQDQGLTKNCIDEILAEKIEDKSIKIRVIYLQRNVGPGGARNAGWDIAEGRYIAFLDADDAWVPDKLFLQYSWMMAHPEFGLTFHASCHNLDKYSSQITESLDSYEMGRYSLLFRNSIPTRSVMLVNTPKFRFPPAMSYAEDYWLWLEMKTNGVRIACLLAPLAITYKREYGDRGLSANLSRMHDGVNQCYYNLLNKKKISYIEYCAIRLFEKMKYFRRIISVSSRKILIK